MADLRSDTVTRPTPAMLEAMMRARVGDDVYGEDESVNELQDMAAAIFGREAALFCPSGTMTNQIAIKVHTQPGDEVICDRVSHVYSNEGGGIAFHSGASVRLLNGDRGRFTAGQVRENINPAADAHCPVTRLVSVENSVNRGGGCCWDMAELVRIRAVCDESKMALHLDGARLFNALAAKNQSAGQYGKIFDTISVCLSKGLGAPAGSLLIGSKEHIARAHRLRKVMGGGMRQAGYIAAAGIYALKHHVERLIQDHDRARRIEGELRRLPYVESVLPVETNIVIFDLREHVSTGEFLRHLDADGIKASAIGPRTIRFVFHLDVGEEQVANVAEAVKSFAARSSGRKHDLG
jgi:threonine aldolase